MASYNLDLKSKVVQGGLGRLLCEFEVDPTSLRPTFFGGFFSYPLLSEGYLWSLEADLSM